MAVTKSRSSKRPGQGPTDGTCGKQTGYVEFELKGTPSCKVEYPQYQKQMVESIRSGQEGGERWGEVGRGREGTGNDNRCDGYGWMEEAPFLWIPRRRRGG